jgi:hypothetical protein
MARRTIFILGGAMVAVMILVGVSVFLLMPTITAAFAGQTTPTPTVVASPSTTAARKNNVALYVQQYATTMKTQLAQGLKLTPDQLTTQLRSGKTLSQIATAQGVSATNLQSLIASTLQSGLQPAVDAGNITQKQVDALIKRYQKNPDLLDRFLGASAAKQKGTAAATPTPTP